MESVSPVVVGNWTIIFLYSDEEPNNGFILKSAQPKQVGKHEQSFSDLHHVIQVECIKGKPEEIVIGWFLQ